MNRKRFTALAFLFLSIAFYGCDALVDTVVTEPEDNDLIGVWTLDSIDGQTVEEVLPLPPEIPLADYFFIWTFDADGGFELLNGFTPAPNAEGVYVSP